MFSSLYLHILNKLMLHMPVRFTGACKIFVQFKQRSSSDKVWKRFKVAGVKQCKDF